MPELSGKKIAILAADGVEEVELTEPKKTLEQAGAQTVLVSLKAGQIQAMEQDVHAAGKYDVQLTVDTAANQSFDGLFLPGGTTNPDALRINGTAVAFVKSFVDGGKPVAAICHGPWTLINAKAVEGKRMTSWPSLEADLTNAGASWVDETVVKDGKLVTSRNPKDLPAFCKAIVDLYAET